MFKWIAGFIDRIFAVIGAFTFSQIPLFMLQYQQHLFGRIAELQMQVQAMQSTASLTDKTLHQYVFKFLNSGDIDFKNQGILMNNMIERYQHLKEGYNALQEASVYSKPIVFIKFYDHDIAHSTWHLYEMGFSFSFECLAYAVLGIAIGLMCYRLISKIIKKIFKILAKEKIKI